MHWYLQSSITYTRDLAYWYPDFHYSFVLARGCLQTHTNAKTPNTQSRLPLFRSHHHFHHPRMLGVRVILNLLAIN